MAQREREGDVLGATQQDLAIMAQMGKRQQLRRIFSFLPTLALAVTLLASWESVAEAFPAGLNNGGPVSLVHDMILSFSSTLALAASLTEMASMCPIAGRWHGTLLMWAVVGKLFAVNVWAIQLLPVVELIGGICHGVFFVMLLVTLVALAPPSSADFFATDFVNGGGWSSDGVSWCIGLLTLVYCFVGFDGALHMSEEVQDSASTVPKVLAFAFLIAPLFCIGNASEVLSTSPGYPIIAIFEATTASKAAATAMESGLLEIASASGLAPLASFSRLTFAFARDGKDDPRWTGVRSTSQRNSELQPGLPPFSVFFAHISHRRRLEDLPHI